MPCHTHCRVTRMEREIETLAPFRVAFHNAQEKIGQLESEKARLERELTARGLGWVVRQQSTNQ